MRLSRLALPVAGLLGAAVAVLPSVATGTSPPTTASFTAVDFDWHANGGTDNSATISPGGTVTISYPVRIQHAQRGLRQRIAAHQLHADGRREHRLGSAAPSLSDPARVERDVPVRHRRHIHVPL